MQRKLTKPHKVVSEGRTVELPVGYVRVPRPVQHYHDLGRIFKRPPRLE